MIEQSERITFGEVIAGSIALMRRHAVPGLAYIAALGGLQAALMATDSAEVSFWPILLGTTLGSYFLIERVMVGEGIAEPGRFGRHIGTYLGITLLAGIASLFGLAFFILPGLILLARWSVAIPLAIGADLPAIEAMSRSWEITRVSKWSLVGFYAVFMLGQIFVGGLTFGFTSTALSATGFATDLLRHAFDAAGMYAMVAIVLRLEPDKNSLGEIFS